MKRRHDISLLLIVLLGGGLFGYLRYAPDRYDPLAPIAIAEPPSLFTGLKLGRLKDDAAACFAALDVARIDYVRLADRQTGPGCGLSDAAVLQRSLISWGGGVRLSCPMLAALAVWERHDVQPLATSMLGSPVARVNHLGSYACRNVNHARQGRRSEHAQANAIDIAGFTLADGRRISVVDDWTGKDAKGDFLRTLHNRACGRFRTVLGPAYNRLHENHFHLDMGPFSACR